MKKIILIAASSLLINATSPAMAANASTEIEAPATMETSKPYGQWWLNLGLGIGGKEHSGFGGIGSTASLNYRFSEHQMLSARVMRIDQFPGSSSLTDAGIMYGLIAKGKYGYISGNAGLGYVIYDHDIGGFLYHSQHIDTTRTVGIPLELQAFVTPIPYVGIGLIGFGNINQAKTVTGIMLALQVGVLR